MPIAQKYPYMVQLDSTFGLICGDYFTNGIKMKVLLVVVRDPTNGHWQQTRK